ncbi:ABC transporter ATP-binding protein [Pelomonas sp. HMWF004]|nr:ABC transporter ATP-binding protein [Pelomonas sp. HMWF004]
MIDIQDLHKQFIAQTGGSLFKRSAKRVVHAVQGVTVAAGDGRITGLLGANGAGKTTTLRMLAGLFPPDAGHITVDGIVVGSAGPVTGRPEPAQPPRGVGGAQRRTGGTLQALARMGILGDAHGLYPRLSARENIVYYGRLQGMQPDAANTRAEELARLLELKPLLDRRAEGFSQGERMKTALARALVHDPANIVLDEPTNGLDVLATRALREALRWLRSPEGGSKCIIVSTHIMQEVEQLCDEVVVVSHGRSVARGSVPELLAQAGETRFEDAFVKLAFPQEVAA